MSRRAGAVAAALLALALSGAAAVPAGANILPPRGPAQAVSSNPGTAPTARLGSGEGGEGDSDLGNGRPQVSYDGLMVRRRVVLAVHPTADADVVRLRNALEVAATRRGLTLADISPDVLGPVLLAHLVPALTLLLPVSASIQDADRLIDPASHPGGSIPGVDHIHVESVLVHDLRFTVRSSDPASVVKAIAREGILTDSLGTYDTTPADGDLVITYTGPLLSDETIAAVRVGVARGANAAPSTVTVSARSTTGVGVDMSTEPELAVPEEESDAEHGGDAGASTGHDDPTAVELPVALSTDATPASPSFWGISGIAATALLLLVGTALLRSGRARPGPLGIDQSDDRRRTDGPPHP
ncbi:MAG: hypothetical protein ABIX44_04575 [Cryobacterium sp.]